MVDIGHFSLAAAWLLALYSTVVGFFGAGKGDLRLTLSSRNGVYAFSAFLIISLCYLAYLFLNHDYSYSYVWRTSNNDMPAIYLVSAIWGGMDGSLLLWAAIMGIFSTWVCYLNRKEHTVLNAWLIPAVSLSCLFFISVTLFLTNPFRPSPVSFMPSDGNGLNPLLQNPSMLIHPPLLYLGFTGFMIPFAYGLAALMGNQVADAWADKTRHWTLVAWTFLTAGIILGGNWAYIELGWGGYWAWDPVENASFMPWLTGTAFLHSIMVERYRGMLKLWNVSLAIGTYLLAVFGTFLTRSGVVQSVHAFAETDVGWVFLAYIAVLSLLSLVLILLRRKELRPENKLESYFSREAVFLMNNLLLLSICFATLWGVIFPLVTEALSGEKKVLGPPYFNAVNSPLFLLLVLFMGIGPLISWKKTSLGSLKNNFKVPAIFAVVVFVVSYLLDPERIFSALMLAVLGFSIACIFVDLKKLSRGEGNSVLKVLKRRPDRFGGLVVHSGVLLMALGILISSVYKIEKDLNFKTGDTQKVGTYLLELVRVAPVKNSNYEALIAEIKVFSSKTGLYMDSLYPESRFYPSSGETTSEVALRISLFEDLYLAFGGFDKETLAVKIFINPLQMFVWFGAIVMLLGSLIVFSRKLYLEKGV